MKRAGSGIVLIMFATRPPCKHLIGYRPNAMMPSLFGRGDVPWFEVLSETAELDSVVSQKHNCFSGFDSFYFCDGAQAACSRACCRLSRSPSHCQEICHRFV